MRRDSGTLSGLPSESGLPSLRQEQGLGGPATNGGCAKHHRWSSPLPLSSPRTARTLGLTPGVKVHLTRTCSSTFGGPRQPQNPGSWGDGGDVWSLHWPADSHLMLPPHTGHHQFPGQHGKEAPGTPASAQGHRAHHGLGLGHRAKCSLRLRVPLIGPDLVL